MLKKFSLEDSKRIKTPIFFETKLTRDEDEESVDNTKYRSMIGSLLYLTASRPDIMFSVCLCARLQEDPKTSHLEAWFSKKKPALAISTTKAEYVFAGKACQQALWMKQALVDYDIKSDDIPVFCENESAIDLRNISIEMVSSEDNIADILTKPLKREPFNFLRLGLGLMEPNA
ncbi:hypothetical protein Tco_1358962 [Tanacetum coccineum]